MTTETTLREPPPLSGGAFFSVSKKGELTMHQPEPLEELRAQVLSVLQCCPTHAPSIEED